MSRVWLRLWSASSPVDAVFAACAMKDKAPLPPPSTRFHPAASNANTLAYPPSSIHPSTPPKAFVMVCPRVVETADHHGADLKAGLTLRLPDKSQPARWRSQSMGMDSSWSRTCQSQLELRKARKISCSCADQYLIHFKGQHGSRVDQHTESRA